MLQLMKQPKPRISLQMHVAHNISKNCSALCVLERCGDAEFILFCALEARQLVKTSQLSNKICVLSHTQYNCFQLEHAERRQLRLLLSAE